MDLLVAVATHPEMDLMIASGEKRPRTQCKRMDMSGSPMGERYDSMTCKEADKRASAIVSGLRKEKPIGPLHVKSKPEEFVYPNVHFRLAGVKQLKGVKQRKGVKKQGELKGVRVKLSGKKLAVWKLENSDLLVRQRVDDIAACARRAQVKRAKNLSGRKKEVEEVESDEEVEEVEEVEVEERYHNSLHNKELQIELGDLVDILGATDAEAEARLQGIF